MQQKLTQHYKAVLKVKVTQSCLTLCNPVDGSPPDSSVHGILQAGILKWSAIFFSRRSSWPRDRTWASHITVRFFTVWATGKPLYPQWKWKHPWCHPIYYINTPGAGVWASGGPQMTLICSQDWEEWWEICKLFMRKVISRNALSCMLL